MVCLWFGTEGDWVTSLEIWSSASDWLKDPTYSHSQYSPNPHPCLSSLFLFVFYISFLIRKIIRNYIFNKTLIGPYSQALKIINILISTYLNWYQHTSNLFMIIFIQNNDSLSPFLAQNKINISTTFWYRHTQTSQKSIFTKIITLNFSDINIFWGEMTVLDQKWSGVNKVPRNRVG